MLRPFCHSILFSFIFFFTYSYATNSFDAIPDFRELNDRDTVSNQSANVTISNVTVFTAGESLSANSGNDSISRIIGGSGYIFAVHDEEDRRNVEVDEEKPVTLTLEEYNLELRKILQKDQSLPKDDYSLWPKVAEITRKFSLDTSPAFANMALDKVFDSFPSKKLWSHVWSIIPGSTIGGLSEHIHKRKCAIYGLETSYPEIRLSIQNYVANNPSDPFIEFAYYTIGEFEKALKANPNSVIKDVLHYAIGYEIVASLVQDAMKILEAPHPQDYYESGTINDKIAYLNKELEISDNKLLNNRIPRFADRAATARPYFEAVLQNKSTPHADDAAYMLGWLVHYQGKYDEALDYYSKAMAFKDGDYSGYASIKQVVRTFQLFSLNKQVRVIKEKNTFNQESALWYTTAKSAYRNFDYSQTMNIAEQALAALDVSVWRLPETTDSETIEKDLEKIKEALRYDSNTQEIVYVLNASREFLKYESDLELIPSQSSEDIIERAQRIIRKYAWISDGRGKPSRPVHGDPTQALHAIDLTLDRVPKSPQFAQLREWLYYRKTRILSRFAKKRLGRQEVATNIVATINAMEREFPDSPLLDDALAERLYIEGTILKDKYAMLWAFKNLVEEFPNSNAIDNAHTWTARILVCLEHGEEAQSINRNIIRRFPFTRHSVNAVKRMQNPELCDIDRF